MTPDESTEILIRVFHVTPRKNTASIAQAGLDPAFAKTARRALWCVGREQLLWAIAHTANRHGVLVTDLQIYAFLMRRADLIRTRWQGVYQFTVTVQPGTLGLWDASEVNRYLETPQGE